MDLMALAEAEEAEAEEAGQNVSWDLLEGMEEDGSQYPEFNVGGPSSSSPSPSPSGGGDEEASEQYLVDVTRILRQCYYRQNLYVQSAQHCDAVDFRSFLCPILALTGLGTFLGLLAGSPASGDHMQAATLLGSFVSFVALLITKVRGSKEIGRFDVKAEMARAAAGQCEWALD